jgi:outer membrane protein OmpA-like peptidoglycan-associated protein
MSKIFHVKWSKMPNLFCKLVGVILLMILSNKPISAANPIKKLSSEQIYSLLQQGNEAYSQMKYAIASQFFESYKVQATDTVNWDMMIKLADSYWQMRDYKQSGKLMQQLVSAGGSSDLSIRDRIRIAELQARLGNYPQAAKWLGGIANYELLAAGYKDTESIQSQKEDSLDWAISILNINTNFREFSPTICGNRLVYTSNSPASFKERAFGWDGKSYARLWTIPIKMLKMTLISSNADRVDSVKNSGKMFAKRLSGMYEGSDTKPMNQRGMFGGKILYVGIDSLSQSRLLGGLQHLKFNVATASLDNNSTLYFSANLPKDSAEQRTRIGIMEAKYLGESVTNIKNVVLPENGPYSMMHPTINKQGTLMVYSSDKPGGKGGFDLYYTQRPSINDAWGPSKAFVDVNTVGNEVFPYNSADGYLYFSSDARIGFGGLDIYRILLADALKGTGEVEHIPYPINSSSDDFGWCQDSTEMKGYFTSDRFVSNDNIYRFEYQPKPKTSHITGIVREMKSQQPMPGATVFLYNKTTEEVTVRKTNEDGRYTFDVTNLGDFLIKAVETNCKDKGLAMNIFAKNPKNVTFDAPRDIILDLTFKNVWELEDLLYDHASANIRNDAKTSLDSLVKILNKYPTMVELGSHTDSRGPEEYNQRLSQRRAESAVAYVVKNGIDPARITAKGYGESKLKNACGDNSKCKESEHQANRRTEITVTYNPSPANSIDPTLFTDGQKMNVKSLPVDFFIDCK